ncbi:putative inorganic phosphate cotransporter [Ostrinia nubilalis]|uniref:putative inorganic phosphate cotransporter n=1 Tax=Ostrinia furnacalis TaxID=93504 RepID=UPI001038F54B|nr:putative inorganic phosphate cotransporter [Ostrinia furnacalis]XP_028173533.1 putative inorganic phosphate cotransporter [Ostrinia furnacalis]XP_028173535.1 putative inorganic phosphate cotransporter [Ostrinia furnacalis]
MSSPAEESPIINSDIENDVTSSHRNLIDNGPVEETTGWIKSRTVLGIMGFLGFANVYAMRVNLSVAIVAMINSTEVPSNETLDVCPATTPSNSSVPAKTGDFDWTTEQQSLILSSFFFGYVLTQIPGGRIAEIFGGKLVYGVGVLLTAIFTILSPVAAFVDFKLFIVVRVLEGLGEGVTYPAMHAMLARWIPPLERSKFAAYVYAGSNIGTVISLPISGWLCTLDFAHGWPLCFYLFGCLGVIWFIAWMFLVYDSPQTHPRICPKEIEYITATIGPQEDKPSMSIPWCKFLTCVPLWAILIAQCGQSWLFYTQLIELPTYMNNILHYDIVSNARLSAIPYLTSWIAGILISIFADWILVKGWLSRLTSMKLWNTVAAFIPAFGLLGIAWAGCDRMAVMLLLSITSAFGGAVYAGNQMNHIDLSPQFAGTMYGITNAASNFCGFMAPYAIGRIIGKDQQTLGQWRVVFYLAAAIDLGANLFYLFFASTEEQDWSRPDNDDMTASAPVESILFPES